MTKEYLGVKWENINDEKIKIIWPSQLVSYCQMMSDEQMKAIIDQYKVGKK
jgi:hypothetical protein